MPRSQTLLYDQREIAPLRAAATLLLMRDTPESAQGLQVLMTRRSYKASFAPGAYVFPGGGIEAGDQQWAAQIAKARRTSQFAQLEEQSLPPVRVRDTQEELQISWCLAAIRESFEELGILLARDRDGNWLSESFVRSLDRKADFYEQIQAHDLELAADQVFWLAHWITDRDMPKRFDVPFLVAKMPAGQTPLADETEQFAPEWGSPLDALNRYRAGSFSMIFPTVRTLERLAKFKTVGSVLEACTAERPLWASCPRAGLMHGKEYRVTENESAYGELALVSPYGQIVHELSWQHEKPVQLLQHVARLTAPNQGMMTGPGTNTYIIGTPESGYLVIDPGPDISEHIARIMDYTDGEIVAIVCTHSHADHSPAARPLQALVVEASNSIPAALTGEYAHHMCPILGMPSGEYADASAFFEPDKVLQNQERLGQYFRTKNNKNSLKINLLVVHTPGHASNHLCFVLPEDGLLISGDHILNGSTTVVNPPDGDMTEYLHSLDRLQTLAQRYDLRFILPAHGHVLSICRHRDSQDLPEADSRGGVMRAIAQLKVHRLKREAKVIAAMRIKPQANAQELLPLAYDDVDASLWPVAARSLAAHMERIQKHQLL